MANLHTLLLPLLIPLSWLYGIIIWISGDNVDIWVHVTRTVLIAFLEKHHGWNQVGAQYRCDGAGLGHVSCQCTGH